MLYLKLITLGINDKFIFRYISHRASDPKIRSQKPRTVPHSLKTMKASNILALLPSKLEDMPKIATSTQKPTIQYVKVFQECIQYQAMAITSIDPLLGFLGLFIKDSIYNTLSEKEISFIPLADPGQSPPDATGTTAPQITKCIHI